MAGFANIGEYIDAHINGQTSFCSFRKVPANATVANWWVDLSMAAGNPQPNYYAAAPTEAAVLTGTKGIFHGYNQSPKHKYLSHMCLQTPTAGLVGQYMLLDYLLYYAFIDGDSSGVQTMDNTTVLPRYTDGAGVQAMYVCVAVTVGGGSFTFDYINQDGNSRTSDVHFYTPTSTGINSILTSQPAGVAGFGPFLRLNAGDTGIRSITSITNLVVNGGLGTIVLVQPIADMAIREINTPAEFSFVDQRGPSARIYDGAYLNLIMNCAASVSAGTLTGFGQFVWG